MASLNKVFLIGNLGGDPELRHIPSGEAVCELSLATNESWNDRDGKRQERVEWHRIVVWGKRAEACAKYLQKGKAVFVDGKIRKRLYTDKDGIERSLTEIIATEVKFLGAREKGVTEADVPQRTNEDDEIPF